MCDWQSEYSDVNKSLYVYTVYVLACSKNIFPMGPKLIKKAKQIANSLGKFKGSNGWLDKWKKKFNVRQLWINGESGDVEGPTLDYWIERLPELVACYAQDDAGLFWKALPAHGFGVKGKQCTGGEEKQTIHSGFLCCCIWKTENQSSFWRLKILDA